MRKQARCPPRRHEDAERDQETVALRQNREGPSRDRQQDTVFRAARAEIADEMRRRLELARQITARQRRTAGFGVECPRSTTAVAMGRSAR